MFQITTITDCFNNENNQYMRYSPAGQDSWPNWTRVQRFFHLFILSTTSEKSFIPYKASAAVQAFKVCPVWPRVLSSWGITLLEKLRAADES